MNFYRNNWYYIGGILFVFLAFAMALFGGNVDPIRRIMIVFFMSLLVHQFEEYAMPGGFPMVWNYVQSGERKIPERYPLNKNSAFIANVGFMYGLHILSIIFSNVFLLGLVLVYFGLSQIIIHGFIFNIKMKRFYNPGIASIFLLIYPVGIYYIWYIVTNFTIPSWYWWGAGVILIPVSVIALLLPINLLKNRETTYIWNDKEAERFNVKEKMAKIK